MGKIARHRQVVDGNGRFRRPAAAQALESLQDPARLLGVSRNIPLSAFRWVFGAVAIGFVVNLATGVLLFAQRATTWGTSLPFLIKMGLVIASVATLVPMRSYVVHGDAQQRSSTAARGEVSGSARLLAIASILAWSGAVTAGRLLAYLEP